MEMSFGKPDETWSAYNLFQVPLLYNGHPTKYKAIVKDRRLVAVLGRDYRLLPNEEAVKIASEVAQRVDAEPFRQGLYGDNVMHNKPSTKVYANFLMRGKYDISGRDTVRAGFSVQNGIDGGLAFSATGFTFREVCSNGVFLGYKQIARFFRKHTAGFEIDMDSIVKAVEGVIEETEQTIVTYGRLVAINLNEEIAQKIAQSRLPRKLMPPYIQIEKGELVGFDDSKSLWDVYNDLTAAIWHSVKVGIDSKKIRFDQVHQIIQVVQRP